MLGLLALSSFMLAVAAVPQGDSNTVCSQWCHSNFASVEAGQCTTQASAGTGPCYTCGPQKTDPNQQLCNGMCVNTSSDTQNCGSCGTACSAGATCVSGVCTTPCSTPTVNCNGACKNLLLDVDNCGACGAQCPHPDGYLVTCEASTCILTPTNF